jgi:hypothetical protein
MAPSIKAMSEAEYQAKWLIVIFDPGGEVWNTHDLPSAGA